MNSTNKERYMYILGGGIVAFAVGVIVILIFQPLPEANSDVVMMAIGALLTMAGNVVGYFFGTSKSSADKNELLIKSDILKGDANAH